MDRRDLLLAVHRSKPEKPGYPPSTTAAIANALGAGEPETQAALRDAVRDGLVTGRRDEYWYFWSLTDAGEAEMKRPHQERDPAGVERSENRGPVRR